MLGVSHTPGATLEGSDDMLSEWHIGKVYNDRVDKLVQDNSINIADVGGDLFHVSPLF